MKQTRREFQIRIEGPGEGFGDDGGLLLRRNYRTEAAARRAYPRVIRAFEKERPIEKDAVYFVELIEILHREVWEWREE